MIHQRVFLVVIVNLRYVAREILAGPAGEIRLLEQGNHLQRACREPVRRDPVTWERLTRAPWPRRGRRIKDTRIGGGAEIALQLLWRRHEAETGAGGSDTLYFVQEEEGMVLENRSAECAAELVLLQRRRLRWLEEASRGQLVMTIELKQRAVHTRSSRTLIAARICIAPRPNSAE